MPTATNTDGCGRIIYLSHGGGPLPILGDETHQAMIRFMESLPQRIPEPESILVISAHWEDTRPTVITAPDPGLYYDYYGFPEEAYTLTYPAPGCPELAAQISTLLQQSGIFCAEDNGRGFDHGTFIPLKLMYPKASIPVTQLSLTRGLDPALHLHVGRALQELMQRNLLVIGSGSSFHNMNEFFIDDYDKEDPVNDAFHDWLIATCTEASQEERDKRLLCWDKAPGARYCHPREEHLLPLHVCAGMAGTRTATTIFDDFIIRKRATAFLW